MILMLNFNFIVKESIKDSFLSIRTLYNIYNIYNLIISLQC